MSWSRGMDFGKDLLEKVLVLGKMPKKRGHSDVLDRGIEMPEKGALKCPSKGH